MTAVKEGKVPFCSHRAAAAGIASTICLLALLAFVPNASAGISCRYVAAGAEGASGNRIEIKLTRFEEAVAVLPGPGQNIQVTDDQRMKPVRCAGGKPTMVNIDRVIFTVDRRAAMSSIFIARAPKFGPGATLPEKGGKGITFVARGDSLSFGIGGTDGPDYVSMGMLDKAAAVDFQPDGDFETVERSEIDAFVYAKKFLNILVRGGLDYDSIVGGQYGVSHMPFDSWLKVPTSIYGEEGKDTLYGGNGMDYLDGGTGRDYLIGGPGADQLFGGSGRDILIGSGGRDEIDSTDGVPGEQVDCGPGKDLARMDLKDQDKGCESFRFP